LPYTGLIHKDNQCKWPGPRSPTGNYQTPDPNCDQNPFVTGAYYDENGLACMTPYQFLNNRNYKKEWMAAFIVTADTPEDIQHAVTFAKKHKLGISVFSTGHDMQDRNAGPGPNTLLVRTTCFRNWEPVLNEAIEDAQGHKWHDGFAIVGAGLSFGINFWTNLINANGTYELAAKSNREAVGGTCHSVGIVGWSIGGGRGWTAPKYGLGVDQLIHVDLVSATGSLISANHSHNHDLFYAVRGGGGGFGIIYSIKIKLHKPSCKDTDGKLTMKKCYTMNTANWTGDYDKIHTPIRVQKILESFVKWSVKNRPSWNSIAQLWYLNTSTADGDYTGKNKYKLIIGANQFGHVNSTSFQMAFKDFTTDRIYFNTSTTSKPGAICQGKEAGCGDIWQIKTDKYWCEKFNNYSDGSNCTDNAWHVGRWAQTIRFVVNTSIENNNLIKDLINTWQPSCDKNPYAPCASGYQIHGDLPAINHTSGRGVFFSGGAVSDGFRDSVFQVFNYGVNSAKVNLTFSQQEEWMHYTLGPALYPYSNASYFNEAEYTLSPGQWEERFWGKEHHCKLLETKMKYDPTFTFACRHCVGSEVGSEPEK
jgi:hypothetical protein